MLLLYIFKSVQVFSTISILRSLVDEALLFAILLFGRGSTG